MDKFLSVFTIVFGEKFDDGLGNTILVSRILERLHFVALFADTFLSPVAFYLNLLPLCTGVEDRFCRS